MFVVQTTEWHLKLADFGISRTLEEDESTAHTGPAGDHRSHRCFDVSLIICFYVLVMLRFNVSVFNKCYVSMFFMSHGFRNIILVLFVLCFNN